MLDWARASVLRKKGRVYYKHSTSKLIDKTVGNHVSERCNYSNIQRLLLNFLRNLVKVMFVSEFLEDRQIALFDKGMEITQWSFGSLERRYYELSRNQRRRVKFSKHAQGDLI